MNLRYGVSQQLLYAGTFVPFQCTTVSAKNHGIGRRRNVGGKLYGHSTDLQ